MTYSDKLKDPRWQKLRLEIMQRDGFKCVECGSDTKTLNVHHVFYCRDKEPWEYDDFLLKTYCEDCHKQAHKLNDVSALMASVIGLKKWKAILQKAHDEARSR